MTLQDYSFSVEPGLEMVPGPFSRRVTASLSGRYDEKVIHNRKAESVDVLVLLYVPRNEVGVCEEVELELECDGRMRRERMISYCPTSMATEHERALAVNW